MTFKHIETPEDALSYFLDCQLATVEYFAMNKSKVISEFKRHIAIADHMLKVCHRFKVDLKGTRAEKIESVVKFAEELELGHTGKVTKDLGAFLK